MHADTWKFGLDHPWPTAGFLYIDADLAGLADPAVNNKAQLWKYIPLVTKITGLLVGF